MTRIVTQSTDAALRELPSQKSMPAWLERDIQLPFPKLTGDEFEILCFLLLRAKFPNDRIYYYGKTSDMGRDIIHISANGHVRLIQCKNFSSGVGPSATAAEMAKVFVNVQSGKIPEKPDEVVFFVSKDLSAKAQDLIEYQDKWREIADVELKKFLRTEPSHQIKKFAHAWWPFGDRQSGLAISEDVKKYNVELIDDFFTVRKVIDASRAEIRQDVREELNSAFQSFSLQRAANDTEVCASPRDLPIDEVRSQFILASKPLSNWPRTLGDSRWIERPEADAVLENVGTLGYYDCVLLGDPGSGKSAFLAHIARLLEANGTACLGIKADTLDVNVDSLGKLAERLRLPASVADCVMAIAAKEKVVVLIDQLDALADLVDLRSERLNVLLNLIHQLAATPNVYVIASSRTFEFNHDARFRTIEAEELHLSLPKWETVSEFLKPLEIDGSNWPDSFRDILRAPQNLKIFVEHLAGTSEQKVFDSYLQMLEGFWYQKVTRSSESGPKSDLLAAVSQEMSDSEVLWLPLARYDRERPLIDQLVSDGIFKVSENGMKFGFQHQTLFSHARSRAVVQGSIDLCDFVKARQHALFVRPTLWSTLGYLREVARETYTAQMARLCSEPLRLHILHLLLDFLGRLHDPDDFEESWLVNWLEDDDFRRRAILSISGSDGWFTRLKDSHIAELLRHSEGIEWQLVGLLSRAINQFPEATVSLLQETWLDDANKDHFTFRVFDELAHWSQQIVAIACRIIERTRIDEALVAGIASNVSAHEPELAPLILATEFRKQLRELQSAADPPMEELPADATVAERMVAQSTYDSKDRFRKLLQSDSGRFEMPAIAEAAPLPFLNEIWPLFKEALEPTLEEPHHIIHRFRSSRWLHFEFDESRAKNYLIEAIRVALQELGNHDLPAFEEFVHTETASDSMLVQRLICRCLVESTAAPTALAFEYLTGDPRKLLIGGYGDYLGDSRNLIATVTPNLSAESLQQLEQIIEDWSEYHSEIANETADTRKKRRIWDREKRLRLRLAIPKHLLTDKSKASLEAEMVALPTVIAGLESVRPDRRFVKVTSRMSTEQMHKANDAHILKLFDELTDDTSWDHPRRSPGGGTIEASHALAELAKEDPQRTAKLAKQLRSDDQQIPASYVVQAISETGYPSSELFGLIRELVSLGFNSEDFQVAVGNACRQRACVMDGMPEDICDLLSSWLDGWTFPAEGSLDDEDGESDEERERSVVFDVSCGYVIPHGTYSILSALAFGLVRKNPPAAEVWLDILSAHLERPENTKTWQAYWRELQMVSYCDHSRAVSFLNALFAKYPTVRDSRFGALMIVEIRQFLGEEAFTEFCDQFRKTGWPMGRQVNGELLGGSYLAGDGFQSVDEFVKRAILFESEADIAVLKGIAFAAANLWNETGCRSRATDVIERLVKLECRQLNCALAHVFLHASFVPGEHSRRILQASAENPAIVRDVNAYHFAEILQLFVASVPDIVLILANSMLDEVELQRDGNRRSDFGLSDGALTGVAMALQRMDERLRNAGLDLFERLLRLGFYATVQTINELDNRPLSVVHPVRRRRHRRT